MRDLHFLDLVKIKDSTRFLHVEISGLHRIAACENEEPTLSAHFLKRKGQTYETTLNGRLVNPHGLRASYCVQMVYITLRITLLLSIIESLPVKE